MSSDLSSGARAPDGSSQVAGRAADVRDTAKEQAQRVGAEAKTQARNVATDLRDRMGEQARTQNAKLVGSIRQTADQLDEMRGDRQDSPAATVVSRVADGGRQLADYLDRNGLDGVLNEVQDFARRRPGAFLATALVAGFVVGRLGKTVAKADPDAGKPSTDSFVSAGPPDTSTGYAPGTAATGQEYPTAPDYPAPTGYTTTEYAATGTGTPVAVEEEYGSQNPAANPDYPGGAR